MKCQIYFSRTSTTSFLPPSLSCPYILQPSNCLKLHHWLLDQECCLDRGEREKGGQHNIHIIVWCSFSHSAQMYLLFLETA